MDSKHQGHTEGPWEDDGCYIIAADGSIVAELVRALAEVERLRAALRDADGMLACGNILAAKADIRAALSGGREGA